MFTAESTGIIMLTWLAWQAMGVSEVECVAATVILELLVSVSPHHPRDKGDVGSNATYIY